jgi:hypothetical protein
MATAVIIRMVHRRFIFLLLLGVHLALCDQLIGAQEVSR